MKQRDTLVGVFAGAMLMGVGAVNADCVLTPRLTIMEVMEGQSAHIEAVCDKALDTINWQVKEVGGAAVSRTKPQQVWSGPKEVIRYQLPSVVRNNAGSYSVGVLGRLADGLAVYSRAESLVTVR